MKTNWIVLAAALALGSACRPNGRSAIPAEATHSSPDQSTPPASATFAEANRRPDQASDPKRHLLAGWLEAHNAGDEESIGAWIETAYSTELLQRVTMAEHIAFYQAIVEDFGVLAPDPILEVEASDLRLVVHLRPLAIANPDPRTTLVVEVDLDPDALRYLKRGLGAWRTGVRSRKALTQLAYSVRGCFRHHLSQVGRKPCATRTLYSV